jgi:hypothetical protein
MGSVRNYSPETLAKLKETVDQVRKAAIMAHRVDYLVCGDDGEDTFFKRLDNDLKKAGL